MPHAQHTEAHHVASLAGGKLAENTVHNLADEVSLKRDHVQAFNRLLKQALNAKQFEVTSLVITELAEQGAALTIEYVAVADASGDLSCKYQEPRYFKVVGPWTRPPTRMSWRRW